MKNTLQTLDRGLYALDLIAKSEKGMTVSELAVKLEISRAIAYRIITTLENHGLIVRMRSGKIRLGAASVLLSNQFQTQLRAVARPLLWELAHATAATAFISIAQAQDCYVIMAAEPNEGLLRVSYRVGSKHPLDQGAAGIAILSARPATANDSEAVRQARQDGYSLTRGQLQVGAIGVSSPIITSASDLIPDSCVGVVALEGLDQERAITEVMRCAKDIAEKLDTGV